MNADLNMKPFIGIQKVTASNKVYTDKYFIKSEDDVEYIMSEESFNEVFKEPKTLKHIINKDLKLPHQIRVLNEAKELEDRVSKLNEFVTYNDLFLSLSKDEQDRLQKQLLAMIYYLTILVERISNF